MALEWSFSQAQGNDAAGKSTGGRAVSVGRQENYSLVAWRELEDEARNRIKFVRRPI